MASGSAPHPLPPPPLGQRVRRGVEHPSRVARRLHPHVTRHHEGRTILLDVGFETLKTIVRGCVKYLPALTRPVWSLHGEIYIFGGMVRC